MIGFLGALASHALLPEGGRPHLLPVNTAEWRDELAPFQLIELHLAPPSARAGLQDIELAKISQRAAE
jgi:hypothetical protein